MRRKSGRESSHQNAFTHTQRVAVPDIKQDVFDRFTGIDIDQPDLHVPRVIESREDHISHITGILNGIIVFLHWQTILELGKI